jgi:hypothetical protein
MTKTFKHLLATLETSNVHQITERAITANGIAKLTNGRSRELAYAVKQQAILRLVDLNWANIVPDPRGPATLFRLHENGRGLHLVARQVTDRRERNAA